MLKILKENRYDIVLLSTAALFVLGSVWGSLAFPEGNWFCRSGAVMVLLAVMVEFHIGKLQQAENSDASLMAALEIPLTGDLGKDKQILSKCAHVFAILGTLIWGYGDLIF